jgi:O-antigen/teichoic acid export membrane protein
VNRDATGNDVHTAHEVPTALAWSLVSKLLVAALSLVSNALIVRGLGEETYGVYGVFLNIARFLSLAMALGLAQGILQFLPELRVRGDGKGTRQLLGRSLVYQLLAYVAVLALILPFRQQIAALFHPDFRFELSAILPLGTALLLSEVLWNTASHVFMAVRSMRRFTVASVVQKVVLVGALGLMMGSGLTLVGVLLAVAGSFVIGILLLAPWLPQALPWMHADRGMGLPATRLMRYALPIALGALINQVLWRSSETLIIGHYWRPADVTYFNTAYNLPQMILEFVPLAIWPIVLATLSEVHARHGQDLIRGVRLYFRLMFILVVPAAVTGAVLGGQVYLAVYGADLAPGAGLCQAFCLVFLLSFLVTPLRMALFVKEKVLVNTLIAIVGAVINVILDFVFIPRYGIWGGIPPVAIALLASGILQYLAARRMLPGVNVPWGHFGRVLLASSIVLPLWFLRESLGHPMLLMGALAVVTILQYLLLRVLRVYGQEEREIVLRSGLPRKALLVRVFMG